MKIKIHSDIGEIPAEQWNHLVYDRNPFVRHEFLHALEKHGCVGEHFGWIPRHLAVYRDGRLLGAMPLYEKRNSYGEFVFDNAWADAYTRSGMQYFPKLVSAIPYTPVTGQRLLAEHGERAVVQSLLVETAKSLAREVGASGVHWLFADSEEQDFLEQQPSTMIRHDCQFHWQNRGYRRFDDFLTQLKAKKRKNIRQERRSVAQARVNLRRLNGNEASVSDWEWFDRFYQHTFSTKWGMATLNREFFIEVAKRIPDQVLLVMADIDSEPVAGALMYQSDTRLYGRFWGATRKIPGLHFEACYYQGIEHCIDHGLEAFEPGAQGEHKIARGFVPQLTRSTHWLQETPLGRPIEQFCAHERDAVRQYMNGLNSPYHD